nr:MarP family serine protease [Leifsonia psychrotolerans]
MIILLISAVFNGYRSGLVRSISSIVGLVLGAVAAYFVVPLVGSWVTDAQWRTPAALLSAVVLLAFGLSFGRALGSRMGRRVRKSALGLIDRVSGALFTLIATALTISLLAFSVSALGVPFLSPAIASSTVIRTINLLTPDPVQSWLAEVRSIAVADGLPLIVDVFDGPPPTLPDHAIDNPSVAAAEQSVVRITGNAFACGQNQSGSGFVVAPNRVITNAHVVSGVSDPVVEAQSGQALQGKVVYFDAVVDLAVIAVDGLSAPALAAGTNLTPSSVGVAAGYPFGGPFVANPAAVLAINPLVLEETSSQPGITREVYTLASDIQQGASGGPLLSTNGAVVGVVFAKSANTANVGYALGMSEVKPVIDKSASLDTAVSSGSCVRG